jgi:hypothetical protein
MATLDNVEPELKLRVTWMIRLSQGRFWVQSGWRSVAEQTALYNLHQSDPKHYPTAAAPGTSKHNRTPAEAVDLACLPDDDRLRVRLAKECGLWTPVKGEPWHHELDPLRLPLPPDPKEDYVPDIIPNVVTACAAPGGGVWSVAKDGGVGASDGAPFFGSYPGLKPEAQQGGPRYFIGIQARGQRPEDGYIIFSNDGHAYAFHPGMRDALR